jgi:hypothetical protein
VDITGSIKASPGYEGFYYGCAAFYNAAGDVVRQLTILGFGDLPAGVPQSFEVIMSIPAEVLTTRLWIVGPGANSLDSDYAALMTDSIPIH